MARAGTAYIDYEGRFDGLQRHARSVSDDVAKRFGRGAQETQRHYTSAFGSIAKLAAGTLVAAGGLTFLKDSVAEAREAAKVGRITDAVIKSTGGSARISAKAVGDLATQISNKVGVDDEAIQSGENLLLTFTNVQNRVGKGNDIFNRATQTITDMSAALGQDMKSSSIQLGKALNDPIKGITALSRVGVSFTQQQKDQIKVLVKSGDTLGAQKIILNELGKEFGGAAEAATDPAQKLGVIWKNLEERVGTALLPILAKAAKWLGTILPKAFDFLGRVLAPVGRFFGNIAKQAGYLFDVFRSGDDVAQGFAEILDSMFGGTGRLVPLFRSLYIAGQQAFAWIQRNAVPAVKALVQGLQQIGGRIVDFIKANPGPFFAALGVVIGTVLLSAVWSLVTAIAALFSPVILIVGAVALLAAGIVYAYQHFSGFRAVVDKVRSWLVETLWPAVQAVATGIADAFGDLVGWVQKHWAAIQQTIGIAIAAVRNIISAGVTVITTLWRTFGDILLSYVKATWSLISGIVQAAINIVAGIVRVVMAVIHGDWGAAWDGIKQILRGAWDAIKAVIQFGIDYVKTVLAVGWAGIKLAVTIVWGAIGGVVSGAWTSIKRFVQSGIDAVLGIVKRVGGSIRSAWDTIWSGISSAVSSVWNGIASAVVSGINIVIGVLDRLIGAVNAVLSHLPGGFHIGTIDPIRAPNPFAGGGGGATHHLLAAGGRIPGYGGGDKVNAKLERGEFVVNKQSTREHLGELLAINRGWGNTGGRRFSLGGWVGDVVGAAGDFLSNPLGSLAKWGEQLLRAGAGQLWKAIRSIAEVGIDHAPLGKGVVRDLVDGSSQKVFDGITSWITGADQAQSKKNDETAASLGGFVGAALGPITGGLVARAEAVIKSLESGGNYRAYNAASGAAGAYQFLASTWAGYGGYGSARDAPPGVQDAKAAANIQGILARYGVVEAIPSVWYVGSYHPGSQNYVPGGANTVSVQNYVNEWMRRFNMTAPGGAGGAAGGHRAFNLGGLVPFVHDHTFDMGGTLKPGWNLVPNGTGGEETLVPTGTPRDGPAVNIENAIFESGVDVDLLLEHTAFHVARGRL